MIIAKMTTVVTVVKTSENQIKEPFFIIARNFIKLLGIWPKNYETLPNKILLIASLLIITFLGTGIVTLEILFHALHQSPDYVNTLKTWGTMGYHTITTIKLYHWVYYLPKLCEVIDVLQRDSFNIDEFLIIDGEDFRTHYITLKNEGVRMATIVFYTSMFLFFNSYFFCYFMTLTFNLEIFSKNFTRRPMELPYNNYHIFNINETMGSVIEALYQCASNGYVSYAFVAIDMCLIGLIIHITTQSRIIGRTLERLDFQDVERSKEQVFKCARETNYIISMMETLDEVLKYLLLEQYLLMTISICTFLYVIPLEEDQTKMLGNILFIANLSLEPLFMGWFCQEFTEEFENLSMAVYNMNWMDADIQFQKDVSFMIFRMQKPVALTLGNFVAVDVAVFVFIMKTGYSFYTLIAT